MAKRRRKGSAKRVGGGGSRSLSGMFNGLGRFARPVKGVAMGALTGWLTRQSFFTSIPAIGGSRLVTTAILGAFLSEQRSLGMAAEIAGEVGLACAYGIGFQYGQGATVSGSATDDLEDRLADLEDEVAGELEDSIGDDDDIAGDDDVAGDDDDDMSDVPGGIAGAPAFVDV